MNAMIALRSADGDGLGEPERLAVLYAPRSLRPRYRSLLLLDAQLARIVLKAREPALAQLKLAWWREACLDLPGVRGHPLVRDLAAVWHPEPDRLIGLVDAWEELAVSEGVGLAAAEKIATARAEALASAAGLTPTNDCVAAARRWTLATLAAHAIDRRQRDALVIAAAGIGEARLPRALRPLALLDGLSRRALRRQDVTLLGDRLSPLAALRLGIFGR